MRALVFSIVIATVAPSDGCPLSKLFASGNDASTASRSASDGGPDALPAATDAGPSASDASSGPSSSAGSTAGACTPPCTFGRICMNGACACPHPGDVFCAKGCTNPKSDNFACGCTTGGAGAVCKVGEECCGARCIACASSEPLDRATCACKKTAVPPAPPTPSTAPTPPAPAGKIVCGDCMGKCLRKTLCTACCTGTPDDCARLTRLCGP